MEVRNISSISNEDAEIQVLGAIFLDGRAYGKVGTILKYNSFYSNRHKLIYSAMSKLYECGEPIDVTTVSEKLGATLSQIGGISYLSQLSAACPSAANIVEHAKIVAQKYANKRMIDILQAGIEAINKGKNSEEISEDLITSLCNANEANMKDDGGIESIAMEFMEVLEKSYKAGGAISGMESGYKQLDDKTNGFNKGNLVILAGRPSMGKSALAVNFALNVAKKPENKVAYFNLEMTKLDVMRRLVSNVTAIPLKKLFKGEINDMEWAIIGREIGGIVNTHMRIYEKLHSISDIAAECRRVKAQYGLDVVVVDYLQLISVNERTETRNMELTKISRALKQLAIELDICIIALSQLSRASEIRADHRPKLADLRESGAIEQDADTVMFVYRDEYYNPDSLDKNIMECIVSKNRNGEIGKCKMKWQPEVQRVVGW